MKLNDYEKKLVAYMEQNVPSGRHMVFPGSCHSVAEAALSANVSPEEFVKNVCMITADGELIVAIVGGVDIASTSRVGKALGLERPRLATPEEMLEKTGYPCGGTPSFGFPAVFLVDPLVVGRDSVITGGGSERSLVRVATKDLLRANIGRVVRIRR